MYDRTELPRRPAIPASLYALAAVLAVERSMLAEGAPWLGGRVGRIVMMGLGAIIMVMLFVPPLRIVCILVAVAVTCAWVLSSLCVMRIDEAARALASVPVSSWELHVEGDPSESAQGYRCRASVRHGVTSWGDVWLASNEPLDPGTTVRCAGRFVALGDDEWAVSSRMQGICGTVRAVSVLESSTPAGVEGLICDIRSQVIGRMRPDESETRALLAGCVCGWRVGLKAFGLDELFSRCGCAHLVAVSGGHLSVLVALLGVLFQSLALRPRGRAAVLALTSGAFVVLCGSPPSAVRAWVMNMVATTGGLLGRRAHALSGVCVVGLSMALLEPMMSGRLGFVLSVVSVCGLCVYGAYGSYVMALLLPRVTFPRLIPPAIRRRINGAWSSIRQSMAAAAVASVVTLPLIAQSFKEVSVVGPLANAVVSLPFTLMVAMGIVSAALTWAPPLQSIALRVADVPASIVLAVLRFVDALPIPLLHVGETPGATWVCIVGLLVILVWWPRLSPRSVRVVLGVAVLCAVCVTLRWRFFAPARICILDVGQGDAILVQNGASAILVDAGPDDAVTVALAREHVTHLDAVVVTHLHDDHYGGVTSLASHVACDQMLVADGVSAHVADAFGEKGEPPPSIPVREIGYGDELRVGGFLLEVVSPTDSVDGDENADSLMLLARYEQDGQRLCALLTGDAERDENAAALARGDLCDLDLLKVGHHGSEVSLTPEQARVLDPEVAVASAGEHNRYGHPTEKCVETLEDVGAVFLCTKDVGDVDVRPGADGPIVRTQREPDS